MIDKIIKNKMTGLLMIMSIALNMFVILNAIDSVNEIFDVGKKNGDDNYINELNIEAAWDFENDFDTIINMDIVRIENAIQQLANIQKGNCILWFSKNISIMGSQQSIEYILNAHEDIKGILENNEIINKDNFSTDDIIVNHQVLLLLDGQKSVMFQGKEYDISGIYKDLYYTSDYNSNNLIRLDLSDKSMLSLLADNIKSSQICRVSVGSDVDEVDDLYDYICQIFKDLGMKPYRYDRQSLENRVKNSIYNDNEANLKKAYFVILLFFSAINCLVISELWFSGRKLEYAVKKAFGMNDMMLIKDVALTLLPLMICGLCGAFLIQLLYGAVLNEKVMMYSLRDIVYCMLGFVAVFLISIYIPLIRSFSIKPANTLRQL